MTFSRKIDVGGALPGRKPILAPVGLGLMAGLGLALPLVSASTFAGVHPVADQYTERAYSADPAQWYSQPGRNFQAGVEYTF